MNTKFLEHYENSLQDNQIPVIAYDFKTRELVGEFDSMSKDCKKLFIRYITSISNYIKNRDCHGGGIGKRNKHLVGVKSYKDGRTYHFEYKNKV